MSKALVVLSGGQDSTTCLYIAKQECSEVLALSFNYGQRHRCELDAASKVAALAGVQHKTIDLPRFEGTSPLTDFDIDVGHYDNPDQMPGGVEPTFVPGRNIVFLAMAGSCAAANGIDLLYTGVGAEDFGGYPDCRPVFVTAMVETLRMGLGNPNFDIRTPLMYLGKRATVELAAKLPGCMEALAYSHTCYDGEYPPNPYNHASMLRARGFHEAGVGDPLIMRAKREGLLPSEYPDSGYMVR